MTDHRADPAPLPAEAILVDAANAARLLGCGRTLFLELVAEQRLPAPIQLGERRRLWSIEALRRWAVDEAEAADRFRGRTKREMRA